MIKIRQNWHLTSRSVSCVPASILCARPHSHIFLAKNIVCMRHFVVQARLAPEAVTCRQQCGTCFAPQGQGTHFREQQQHASRMLPVICGKIGTRVKVPWSLSLLSIPFSFLYSLLSPERKVSALDVCRAQSGSIQLSFGCFSATRTTCSNK